MTNTTARVTKGGKHFEVLVDLDEALKLKKGQGFIGSALLTNEIFHNLKSGERASSEDLMKFFESNDVNVVAEKIIKSGDIVLPTDYKNEELDKKYKQVVDFLVKNAISADGRPYTPDRIMKALHEAHVVVKNKPIEEQIPQIIDELSKVLPIKVEIKKVKLLIPAQHTARAYGIINEYKESEDWKSNGDLEVVVAVPAGLIMDFYDKINSSTHGSVLSEEMK